MGNRALRIILRTGQPGFAPIVSITEDYEIDDYKEKAELTSQRLTMSVIASLRTFGYFSELQKLNAELEARVAMRTAELERLSLVDPLTGAANRRHFDARAQAELAEAQRHGRALAIVSLDIDHFKVINDTWGHSGGDEVLKHIVTIAQQCLRPGDLLARIGGEEFVLVLPDTTDTAAAVVAERIRATLAESPVGLKAGLVSYTASFGVSELASDEPSVANALERSDQALYAAKNAGRNQVVLASSLDQPIAHSA
jgi:diguanylate cyclase (GGDEF)-like protein